MLKPYAILQNTDVRHHVVLLLLHHVVAQA